MVTYLRVWTYKHFFQGEAELKEPEEVTKEEIIRKLDTQFHHDNWDRTSLIRTNRQVKRREPK